MAFDPNAVPICIVAVANAVFGNTNEFLDVLVIIPDIYKGRAVPREISWDMVLWMVGPDYLPMSADANQTEPKAESPDEESRKISLQV